MQWQDKVRAATRGTRLGAILAAVLGDTIPAPRFTGRAVATSDGFILAGFETGRGEFKPGALAGSVAEMADNLSGLARHLELTPAERGELAAVVLAWVADDYGNARGELRRALV